MKKYQNYVIEHDRDHPMPEVRDRKYPFPEMKAGDSFACKDTGDFLRALAASAAYARKHNIRFCSRKAELRIWRVA
jgi:hypothetical protein